MNGLTLSCIRDEKTFKHKDDTYKRVRTREGKVEWFVLRDNWVLLNKGKASDMEKAFLSWKSIVSLKAHVLPTLSPMQPSP